MSDQPIWTPGAPVEVQATDVTLPQVAQEVGILQARQAQVVQQFARMAKIQLDILQRVSRIESSLELSEEGSDDSDDSSPSN